MTWKPGSPGRPPKNLLSGLAMVLRQQEELNRRISRLEELAKAEVSAAIKKAGVLWPGKDK